LQKIATKTVNKWTCKGSQAYQSTTANDNSWTKIKLLNLSTGLYENELDLDLGKFAGEPGCENGKCKIRSMNGCAIHLKSSTLYCAMQIYDRGCFLVALDQTGNIGFVSKLNGFRYAATFLNDDYYVSGEEGFAIIKNVPGLSQYDSWEGLSGQDEKDNLVELTMNEDTGKYLGLGADMVIWNKDGTNANPVNQFLMTLKDDELLLIQLLKDGEPFFDGNVIVLAAESASPNQTFTGPGGKRCWGAGWNFNGAIYFSSDDGSGLWNFDSADFEKKTSRWVHKGEINNIDWNDGFTCGASLSPPDIKRVACEHDFYQVATFPGKDHYTDAPQVKTTSETWIRYLDLSSGEFINTIKVNRSKYPDMTSLNACAVHPEKDILYCFMNEENRDSQAIIALDATPQIQLVTVHKKGPGPGKNLCFAAVFDKKGNYWYWCADKTLYKASGLGEKKTTMSHGDENFLNDSGITAYPDQYTNDKVGADFILYIPEKTEKEYLVSIVKSVDSDVSVIDVSDPSNPSAPEIFKSKGLEATKSKSEEQITWGSAWTGPHTEPKGNYDGRHFFTPDVKEEENHNKLYELTNLDFESQVAHFQGAGKASKATWHDGFTCLKKTIVGVDKGKTIKMR